jgi:large subunit ribosomal protein L10
LPLTRSEKTAVVDRMTARLKAADAVVVTDYRGLTVAQISKLRRELRTKGAEFHVVKNSLAQRALSAAGLEMPESLLDGPTAVALLFEDLSGPTKVLRDFAKETNILAIRGGLLSGQAVDAAGVNALADLPSREQLLAQLLGVLQAPQRQLVTVLNSPLRDLVGVLNAHAESGQEAA